MDYEKRIAALLEDFELFAHITSHDLRDPLRQAIINCEEIRPNVDSKSQAAIDHTIFSINQVMSRIGLLREYSYLVSFNKELQPVDCNKILQTAIAELQEKISSSGAKITHGDLPQIMGYEPHILKLFSCIIDNSLRFKGTETPEINISCTENHDHFEFKFSDNGIGIDEVYRHLIFSLFQRLDPEAENASFGAGLGFCKKIIENHHGKIWFESDGQNGTSFFFTIPK